jgi:hypothetical protein
LEAALSTAWPRLSGRVTWIEGSLEHVALGPGDTVVSAHACGALTDTVIERAIGAGAGVCVLPCCHRIDPHHTLSGWLDPALAADVDRVARLQAAGYDVRTQHIPAQITPKNRLIIASRSA